jgi:hypothetical protein
MIIPGLFLKNIKYLNNLKEKNTSTHIKYFTIF